MSKAILVMDMPENCWLCPLHRSGFDDDDEEIMICRGTYRESFYGERPDWCPLKPMPARKMHEEIIYANDKEYLRTNAFNDYEKGYNACIDEMLDEIGGGDGRL